MTNSVQSLACEQGDEDGQLGRKPASGGKPHQAEHHDRHAHGQARRRADQAGVVGDLLAADRVAQEGHDGEGGQIHKQVDADVDHQRGDGRRGPRPGPCPTRATAAATGIIM